MSADFHDLITEAFPEMRPPRRNLRFRSGEETPPVRFTDDHGHEVVGVLDNESYSGIAAVIPGEFGLKTNTEVAVDYFGQPIPGIIRRMVRRNDGMWLVGIEWK